MPEIGSFRSIIALWSTPDAMAAEIGVGTAAARKWWQRDRIPAEWWKAITEAPVARSAGVTTDALAGLAARKPEPADLAEARA